MNNLEIKQKLEKAAHCITKQAEQIGELKAKKTDLEREISSLKESLSKTAEELGEYKKKEGYEKLANLMIEKGLADKSSFQSEVRRYMESGLDPDTIAKTAGMLSKKESEIRYYEEGGNGGGMHKSAEDRFMEQLTS